jgi:Outer membrane protein beta-barrel family
MPSLNLTFAQNEKTNFRFSASRTVARPNFRELAPFTFYDFLLDASIQGNPNLVNTKISNLDVRYEYFPGQNQLVSVSAFYKHFQDPIEQHYSAGGTRVFDYMNSLSAQNFGTELEVRSRLGNFNRHLENLTFFTNVAYVYSEVDQSNLPGAIIRGLQGQSPYILNAGLSYQGQKGTSATVLFNRIGRRIWLVGDDQYKHTYEAPRSVIDFQVTKKILKNGDLKINVGDILNQQAVFYQDQDNNGKFNAKDTKIASSRFGWNSSVSFAYKF